MKTFRMWVLTDGRGRVWTYTDGKPVTFESRSDAKNQAAGLDKKREWKATRAALTVTRES